MEVSIKDLLKCGAFAVYILSSIGCGSEHTIDPNFSSGTGFISTDPALQSAAIAILQNKCAGCHGTGGSGGISNITSPIHLVQIGLITPGNPNVGRLIGSIADGSMPVGGSVSATDLQTLKNWISSLQPTSGGGGGGGGGNTPPLGPTFASIKANILDPKCLSCHGATVARGGIRYDTYANAIATGGINPGSSSTSKIIAETNSGEMPPSSAGYSPLSSTQMTALRQWIDAGALNN